MGSLLFSEQIEVTAFIPEYQYAHTERENMRVYIEDRYRGLQYRQRRVYLQQEEPEDIASGFFRGSVYVVKNLSRDGARVLQPVDRQIPVECRFTSEGLTTEDGSVLPLRTGFPVLPRDEIKPGDTWKADGSDSIGFESTGLDGEETRIPTPFHCTYTYQGESLVMERPAQVVEFEFGFYDASPYVTDGIEVRGRGEGRLSLFVDEEGGYFINERLIRHFIGSDGRVERREEGFRLTWGRGITRGDIESRTQKIAKALNRGDAGATGRDEEEGEIEVESTVEGVKLSLPEIHFYPDEARILPSEKNRLDRLSELLKKVPDADILIKGHTADVGTRESQYVLSVERAKTILREMEQRGLKADRFIYQGLGGDEPLAPNDTEEGRKKNRRVEVIILN